MNLVEIKNLSKSYKDNKALDNVTFEVKKGEIFGLIGPNGAGKSTLISMLTTILKPDSGRIVINGLDVFENKNAIKKILGLVPQEIALYEALSAKENLNFFGKMYDLKGSNLKIRVNEVLRISGLKDRENEAVNTYSGGMKRRLNIAVALLHKPEILIMDEPTVGIDPQSRSHILDNILELNKDGMTVIYTSHYIEEVEYICNKIGIIDKGKLMAIGTKEELKKMIGIDIKDINLEKVFLHLTGKELRD